MFQATGGDASSVENRNGEPCDPKFLAYPKPVKSSGIGFYHSMLDGFWDGATIEIYRPSPEGLHLLRTDRVKSFKSPKKDEAGEKRIILESDGPAVQRGDIYVLTMERDSVPDAVSNPDLRESFFAPSKNSGVRWSIDRSTHCPENGSTASLKIHLPGNPSSPVGMTHQYLRFGGKEHAFSPGKTYKFEAWLKGSVSAPVTLQIGDRGTKQISVTDQWQKVEFDLDNTSPITPEIGELLIGSTGQGTLWLDDMIVRQSDLAPYAINPDWVSAIREFQPGIIRDMGGRGTGTLKHFLVKNQFQRQPIFMEKNGLSLAWNQGNMTLPQLLELCENTSSAPYIMTYILWSDEEIRQFVEYLAAPADKGFGKLRAEDGHPKPWTEVFDKIYIECSNETWNGMFAPQEFAAQPEIAGMVSDRLFRTIKSSPYNSPKFRFVASAFVNSLYRWKEKATGAYNMADGARAWTFRNLLTCKNANAIATAPSGYIGGWDGDTPLGQSDEQLFQSNLLYPAQIMEHKLEELVAMQKELSASHGFPPLELIKYEAGPGYSLPNPQKPFIEESERIGKSYALGTAILDNFLFVIANNGNTNFFKFTAGDNWASHNKSMIPHNCFLSLQLKNRYAPKGDMLVVNEIACKKIDIPEMQAVGLSNDGKPTKKTVPAAHGIPMTRAYAFRNGNSLTVILLNRSATESKEISIKLPAVPASAYKKISYTAPDIRSTNRAARSRDEMEIRLKEENLSGLGKEFTVSLKPAEAIALCLDFAR